VETQSTVSSVGFKIGDVCSNCKTTNWDRVGPADGLVCISILRQVVRAAKAAAAFCAHDHGLEMSTRHRHRWTQKTV
jgi:hypothetical protein